MALTACLLSIGSELSSGQTQNTTARQLAKQLSAAHITVTRMVTLPDDTESIVQTLRALRQAAAEAILIVSGGLGATSDDLTVAAIAKAFGRKVVTDPQHLTHLQQLAQGHQQQRPQSFFKQAEIPEGFSAKQNPYGSAPCIYELLDKQATFLLPGVPRECLGLFTNEVLPMLQSHFKAELDNAFIAETAFTVIGHAEFGETAIEASFKKLAVPHLTASYLPHEGAVTVILHSLASAAPYSQQQTTLAQAQTQLCKTVAPHAITYSGAHELSAELHRQFCTRGWKIGIAESCTGGLLTAAFTQYSGASAYLISGLVSYANAAKQQQLEVPYTVLETAGAVSTMCAKAMASGLSKQFAATTTPLTLSIAITGIAGPDGGSAEKPVGTVYVAFQLPQKNINTSVRLRKLVGNRQAIQTSAVQQTLVQLAHFLHRHSQFFTT